MRQLIVKQLDYDLTPVAGLALVGHYLLALQPVLGRLDAALPVKSGVANSDIVRSYVGLLVQGKSDFDAIENFRGDTFFKRALGIGLLPSSPTLGSGQDPSTPCSHGDFAHQPFDGRAFGRLSPCSGRTGGEASTHSKFN